MTKYQVATCFENGVASTSLLHLPKESLLEQLFRPHLFHDLSLTPISPFRLGLMGLFSK